MPVKGEVERLVRVQVPVPSFTFFLNSKVGPFAHFFAKCTFPFCCCRAAVHVLADINGHVHNAFRDINERVWQRESPKGSGLWVQSRRENALNKLQRVR